MRISKAAARKFVRLFVLPAVASGIFLVLSGSSCSVAPPSGGDPDDELPALAPVPLETKNVLPFGVILTADRVSGVPGTVFTVTAHVSADVTVASFSWSIDGVTDATNVGESATFTFDSPDDAAVMATVTDNQGRQVSDGLLLKVFDPAAAPADRTPIITPASGMPGTIVHIESNALHTADAQVLIQVGDTELVEPFRPELGVANFIVPLNAADGLTESMGTIIIHILADGQDVAQFDFQLSPLPAIDGAPGDLIRSWLESAPQLFEKARSDLDGALSALQYDLTAQQSALLQSMLRLSQSRFEQVQGELLPLLDQLDAQALTVFDQVLIANGLDATLLESAGTTAKAQRTYKNDQDRALDLIVQFHDAAKTIKDLVVVANTGAALLTTLSVSSGGVQFLFLNSMVLTTASLLAELGIAADLVAQIDGLLPHVLDALTVNISPNRLMEDKGVIEVIAHLDSDPQICSSSVTTIIDAFAAQSALRLLTTHGLSRIAFLTGLFNPKLGSATTQAIYDYLRASINQIANDSLAIDQLDDLLNEVKAGLCNLSNRRELHLQPEESIIRLNPSGAGRLLNLQDATIDFYCETTHRGNVNIFVEREAGLSSSTGPAHKLTGTTNVNCFGESCTENALGVLSFNPISEFDFSGVHGSCSVFFPEPLDFRGVTVNFTNTDPFRTIAVATLLLRESDIEGKFPPPCASPPAGQTVQDCIDSITAGCNSPPGLFIAPGETAVFGVLYTCREQSLYPGSGACSDFSVETITTELLVHAVFCDDFDTAQAAFCAIVDPQLLQIGLPSPHLPFTTVTDCPLLLPPPPPPPPP